MISFLIIKLPNLMSSLQALEQPMSQDDLPNNMIKDQ